MKTTLENNGVTLTPAEEQVLSAHQADIASVTDTLRIVLLGRNNEGTVDVAYIVKPVEPSRRLNLWATLSETGFHITKTAPKGYDLS